MAKTDIPNYRQGEKGISCASCVYGQAPGTCVRYDMPLVSSNVCDTWQKAKKFEVNRPHGFLITKEKQTAVVSKDRLETKDAFILTTAKDDPDREAYGVIRFGEVSVISAESFDEKEHFEKHSIYPEERLLWWGEDVKQYFIYDIEEFIPFSDCYPFFDEKCVNPENLDVSSQVLEQISKLPRVVVLEGNAVSFDEGGDYRTSIKDIRISQLAKSYFSGIRSEKKNSTFYSTYSLALVKRPYILPEATKEHSGAMVGFFLDPRAGELLYDLVEGEVFKDTSIPFGATLTPPDEYHLTLFYLGEAADLHEQRSIINRVVQTAAEKTAPFSGKIGGLGRFVEKQRDGSVPFYFNFDSSELSSFREMLISRLASVGITIEGTHGFTPHITLGYLPEGTDFTNLLVPDFSLNINGVTVAFGGEQLYFPFLGNINEKAIWTSQYLEKLPNSHFFYVSPSGERFLPFRDIDGEIDRGQIRAAIARLTKLNDEGGMPLADDIVEKIRQKIVKVIEENALKKEFSEDIIMEENEKAVWSTAFVNSLPDSSFLWVESGGEKDEDGKTTPRSLRHLPYKDSEGKIDLPHLRNAIARAPQLKNKDGESVSEEQIKKLQNKARGILEENENKEKKEVEEEKPVHFVNALKSFMENASQFLGFLDSAPAEEENVLGLSFESDRGVAVKTVNGKDWHVTWSSNNYMDRDGEIFTLRALENYVDGNFNPKTKSWDVVDGFFNFWHIKNTDFAEKKFQGMVGQFLVEAGPYLDTEAGQSAKEFFKKYPDGHPIYAPEGWGASVEYLYLPEEKGKGEYNWTYITRTSTLPIGSASNTFTEIKQEDIMSLKTNPDQKAAAEALFGSDYVNKLIVEGEQKTSALNETDVPSKSADGEESSSTKEEKSEGTSSEEEETPKEDTPAKDEKSTSLPFTLEDVVSGVVEKLSLNFKQVEEGVREDLTKIVETVTEVSERVAALEEGEKTKTDLTNTSRWELMFQEVPTASSSKSTVVKKDDELLTKKPEGQKPSEEETPAESQKEVDVVGAMFN